MTAPAWPLPAGHWFGPRRDDLRNHSGREAWDDHTKLRIWQQRYAVSRDQSFVPDGLFNGQTQRAVLAVQEAHNLPRTGLLDEDTWRAVYEDPPPAPSPPPQEAPKPPAGTSGAPRRRKPR